MPATIATFTVVLRSSWGDEFDVGTISVDQAESAATIKHTIAAMLSAIASELAATAYDGPTAPMPWLDNVDLTEFTDTVPRERSLVAAPGWCGALPARAFRGRYRSGCVADHGHSGNHYTDRMLAERAARRAATLTECDLPSTSPCWPSTASPATRSAKRASASSPCASKSKPTLSTPLSTTQACS